MFRSEKLLTGCLFEDCIASSEKMAVFPTLIVFVLLHVCLGAEHNSGVLEPDTESIACPGDCIEEHLCSVALKDSDCSDGFVCCVERDETMTTTEYAEYFTTEEDLVYSSPEEYEEAEVSVEEQGSDQTISYTYAEDGADEENPNYNYVFSEESEDFSLGRSGDVAKACAGRCMPYESSAQCEYILADEESCPSGSTCCLTEDEVRATSDTYNYFIEEDQVSIDQEGIMKREVPSPDTCPGTCVHPSHALFCGQILSQFQCPLDSICCIRRSTEQSSKVFQCTGQCLPVKMQGYCFLPNELILGPTSCKSGTTCCMQKSTSGPAQPPSIAAMQFPSAQFEAPSDPSQVVLGHLAVDDEGTVFRVGTDGKVSPLPRVSRVDHLRTNLNKLMVYPQSGGHIVIYSDSTGALYQQFYPSMTYDPETPFGKPSGSRSGKANEQKPFWKPVVKRPTEEEFSPQDFEALPEFQQVHSTRRPSGTEKETNLQDFGTISDEPEDIIIPEDDDEAPAVESHPSVTDGKTGRPTCPGSCMSFFLRFTCFRGFAISDGFACPGRSVCCARLSDIENREKLLRSLSPYSHESANLGRSVPECGIKGRRDSQHTRGGNEPMPGEWCWQVAVINVQNQYMCGGALMGDSWVITAAHCVANSMKENQAIFVRAGVTDLKSSEENSKGQTIRVVSTFLHHNFNSINLDNNIALLKLQKPVELGDGVCVVCLPMSGQMPTGNPKCTVTGYGFVTKEREMALKIQTAEVPIVDDTECMANVTEALDNPFILPASSFCAGGEGQQDACQGDAGGPLTCDINGHHELIGLVSWTLGCGKEDVPSIYVKVPAFVGWINEIVSSNSFLTALH